MMNTLKEMAHTNTHVCIQVRTYPSTCVCAHTNTTPSQACIKTYHVREEKENCDGVAWNDVRTSASQPFHHIRVHEN